MAIHRVCRGQRTRLHFARVLGRVFILRGVAMTIGPASLLAIIAAALATLSYWVCKRLGANEYITMFIYGFLLVLVMLAGPLIKLP